MSYVPGVRYSNHQFGRLSVPTYGDPGGVAPYQYQSVAVGVEVSITRIVNGAGPVTAVVVNVAAIFSLDIIYRD
jgi:hypothetical protein